MYTTSAPKATFPPPISRPAASDPPSSTELTNSYHANGISSFASYSTQATDILRQSTQHKVRHSSSNDTFEVKLSNTSGAASTSTIIAPISQRTFSSPASIGQDSAVMNETLNVIDEHITHLNTPRSSVQNEKTVANDSASEYSSYQENRLSYINGNETDEEEHNMPTQDEVRKWSPEQMARYLADLGVEKRHCDVFKEQEISGEVLMELDQESIFLKDFDLGPVGRRLRTWHKIKAFQQDLRNSSAAKATSDYSSSEQQTVLPRIPNLNEGQSVPSIARQLTQRSTPQPPPASSDTTIMSYAVAAPITSEVVKPSAAASRDFGQSKRHSSAEVRGSVSSQISQEPNKFHANRFNNSSHQKQPSFDRNWTMAGSPPSLTQSNSPSAINTDFSHADKVPVQIHSAEPASSQFAVSDLDRGYFSGGEADNRRSRKLLRKKDEASQSRNSSISRETRRRSLMPNASKAHGRIGSVDSMHDSVARRIAPAAKTYFSDSRKNRRAASGPELTKPAHKSQELSPHMMKSAYADATSLDAVATSPRIPESESSSLGQSTPSVTQSPSIASRLRSIGLKSLTDAVSGSEKSTVAGSDLNVSPGRDISTHSPLTGSSTPSATYGQHDLVNSELSKSSAKDASPVLQRSSGATRRTSKKSSSGHNSVLLKKSPQEQIEGSDFHGWMKKKSSNLMTTWKPRLFVLRGSRLSYYYTEDDKEEKGLIDISSHRVLPANNERLTGLHASLTGVSSPTSPSSVQSATNSPVSPNSKEVSSKQNQNGIFIFKLVPPRGGLSRAVNFTKATVHYFAVESIEIGRLWMAALMKVTINRDESTPVVTTYQQQTMSLAEARATRQRPPALMNLDEETASSNEESSWGLAIRGYGHDRQSPPRNDEIDAERILSKSVTPTSPFDARAASIDKQRDSDSIRPLAKTYKTGTSSVYDDTSSHTSIGRRRDTISTGVAGSPPPSATDSIMSSWNTEGKIGLPHVRRRTLSDDSTWSDKYNVNFK